MFDDDALDRVATAAMQAILAHALTHASFDSVDLEGVALMAYSMANEMARVRHLGDAQISKALERYGRENRKAHRPHA
jgi:hypothetical protein